MKLQSITLWEQTFSPENFSKPSFQRDITTRLQSILDQNNADSLVVSKWLEAIKKIWENLNLSVVEEFAIQCLKTKIQTEIIIDWETDEALLEKLNEIGSANMCYIISLCESTEDIHDMLTSMQSEKEAKESLQAAIEILKSIDYSSITKEELDYICELLREFEFNGELLSLIENNDQRKIRVLTNKSYHDDKNIVIQLDAGSQTPYFHLEQQTLAKLIEISTANPGITSTNLWNKKYYKGITFWWKKWLVAVSENSVYNLIPDSHSINGNIVMLVKDIYTWGHHIYLPEQNTIHNINAVWVWTYFVNENGYKIDEDDEDYEEKITSPQVKKIMRLLLDTEKWLHYDFDGEDFWKLKIATGRLIMWRDAEKTLH